MFSIEQVLNVGKTAHCKGIDLIKKGSLLQREEEHVEILEKQFNESMLAPAMKFAATIAKDLESDGVEPSDANDRAIGIISNIESLSAGERTKLLLKYGEEFKVLMSSATINRDHIKGIVAFIIQSRIDEKWFGNNITGLSKLTDVPIKELSRSHPAWAPALVMEMPTELKDAIYEFYQNERMGWRSMLMATMTEAGYDVPTVETVEEINEPLGEDLQDCVDAA